MRWSFKNQNLLLLILKKSFQVLKLMKVDNSGMDLSRKRNHTKIVDQHTWQMGIGIEITELVVYQRKRLQMISLPSAPIISHAMWDFSDYEMNNGCCSV